MGTGVSDWGMTPTTPDVVAAGGAELSEEAELLWGIMPGSGGGTGVSVLVRFAGGRDDDGASPPSTVTKGPAGVPAAAVSPLVSPSTSLLRLDLELFRGFGCDPGLLAVSGVMLEVELPPRNSFAACCIFLADSSASSAASFASCSRFSFFASLSFIPRLLVGTSVAANESTLIAPAGICRVPDSLSTMGVGTVGSNTVPSSSAFFFASLYASGPRFRAFSSRAIIVSLGVHVAFFFIRFLSFASSYCVN